MVSCKAYINTNSLLSLIKLNLPGAFRNVERRFTVPLSFVPLAFQFRSDLAPFGFILTFALRQVRDDLRCGALSTHCHAFKIFLQAVNILDFRALIRWLSFLCLSSTCQRLHIFRILILICLLLLLSVDSCTRSWLPITRRLNFILIWFFVNIHIFRRTFHVFGHRHLRFNRSERRNIRFGHLTLRNQIVSLTSDWLVCGSLTDRI